MQTKVAGLTTFQSAGPQTRRMVKIGITSVQNHRKTLDGRTRHSGPILVGLNRLAEIIVNQRVWLSSSIVLVLLVLLVVASLAHTYYFAHACLP